MTLKPGTCIFGAGGNDPVHLTVALSSLSLSNRMFGFVCACRGMGGEEEEIETTKYSIMHLSLVSCCIELVVLKIYHTSDYLALLLL